MNTRLFAALFTALFAIGAFPILFAQFSGSASAGIMVGFMIPFENLYHLAFAIAIGLLATWMSDDAVLALPLGTLLMLAVGAFTEIHEQSYPAVHYFIFAAVILFSLSMSLFRNKALIVAVAPIMAWAYVAGGGFMRDIPPITTPLFFMLGIVVSHVLVLAIGVALGIWLSDFRRNALARIRKSAALATFLSFF